MLENSLVAVYGNYSLLILAITVSRYCSITLFFLHTDIVDYPAASVLSNTLL